MEPATSRGRGSDDERDRLNPCRTLVEAKSQTSKDIKEAQAHLDRNVLGQLRRGSPGLDSGPFGRSLFRRCTALSAARSPLWRERGTRKSRLETNTENEASSALLARLWGHLSLQNRANGAENLTRLCSATIGQTGRRMVQFGAIRSPLDSIQTWHWEARNPKKWALGR